MKAAVPVCLLALATLMVGAVPVFAGDELVDIESALKAKYPIIGDVRGKGLMLALELVKDPVTKEPATAECARVMEACKDMGLLVGKGGLNGSVIRFAPPMCLTSADADFMLQVFDAAFSSL